MSVRIRRWLTSTGRAQGKHLDRAAHLVDYVEDGGRCTKQFPCAINKGERCTEQYKCNGWQEAETWSARHRVAVESGSYISDSQSITVSEAGANWLERARNGSADSEPVERATLDAYSQHLRLHITPFIGKVKLTKLNARTIDKFETDLRAHNRSAKTVRNVIRSLSMILAVAMRGGYVATNIVRDTRLRSRHSGPRNGRGGKLKVGIDIPLPQEVRAIIEAAAIGRWKTLLMAAALTGLRASELRGLRWQDVDLKKGELHVRQRADRFNQIGRTKSRAGERTVPLTPMLCQALRTYRMLKPPIPPLDLVFCTKDGAVLYLARVVEKGLWPAQVRAGVTIPVLKDGKPLFEKGKPVAEPKYSGMHAFRHFFASWCINRKVDGGLELPPKVVQERLGHATINMTLDTYGHLFPRGDDSAELADAERSLLG
jgi:integrase